ncbi:MAG: cell division protein FtsQ/DivIB [Rhodobacteraceae bacterium]|nr:cell division protein FtsQ/DivIB [Paracoccaceae bacterium]
MQSVGAAPPRPAPRVLHRDPAPSRMRYKLHRLWLTPAVRGLARIGLPLALIAGVLGLWLGDADHRADLADRFAALKTQIQNRPEFEVSLLRIEGASPAVDAAIRTMLPASLPASSFALDLGRLREMIASLDAVASVDLRVQRGVLAVQVTERVPAVLWRHATGVEMLDASGHRIATVVAREVRADLPLIAGEGAEAAVPEALAVLAAATPLLPRARGLVRIGARRWDLVLDRDQRILLPESGAVQAVERMLALDRAEDLLARDFTHLDLRLAARPTLRLSPDAQDEFRRITGQAITTGANR